MSGPNNAKCEYPGCQSQAWPGHEHVKTPVSNYQKKAFTLRVNDFTILGPAILAYEKPVCEWILDAFDEQTAKGAIKRALKVIR